MPSRGPDHLDVERPEFSHVDGAGHVRMVDVTGKPSTLRRATARCRVTIGDAALDRASNAGTRGMSTSSGWLSEVLATARICGIQAGKRTASLVPLCHVLSTTTIDVRISLDHNVIGIEGEATATGPTGVEMEALTACAFAALSIVSTFGPTHPETSIDDLALWEKSGGRSGHWERTSSS